MPPERQSANERTPLLQDSVENDIDSAQIAVKEPSTPLPYASVLTLCFCRLTEPIALTVIFPFINQAIEDTGIPASDVGFRAGFIESLFTFAQFLTTLQYGRLSDRIGRRPVIVC
jgi:MFS family permease